MLPPLKLLIFFFETFLDWLDYIAKTLIQREFIHSGLFSGYVLIWYYDIQNARLNVDYRIP